MEGSIKSFLYLREGWKKEKALEKALGSLRAVLILVVRRKASPRYARTAQHHPVLTLNEFLIDMQHYSPLN